MSMKEMDRRQSPAEWDALTSRVTGGPSLTYWRDCWYRLCRNRITLLSMVVVVIVALSVIFVPMFWPYSCEEQGPWYASIPSELEIYDLGDNSFVYVTSDYKCIDIDSLGHPLMASTLIKDDKTGRTYLYEISRRDLLVGYGVCFRAKSEFVTQEAAHGNGDPVAMAEVECLREYYEEDVPEAVSLREAEHTPEDKIDCFRVFYNGAQIIPTKTVLNKIYIWSTNSLGHDLLIRVVYGARASLLVGVVTALMNLVVDMLYGGIAGYFGGAMDNIMVRIVDTISSIPMMPYVILIMVALGSGLHSITLVTGLIYWVSMVRIVHFQMLAMREQEFISVAILLDVSTRKIPMHHFILGATGPIMVVLTIQIPSAMFTEAFLSFIGLSVPKPQASWGVLANTALSSLYTSPYQLLYPVLIVSITILALNLFSDELQGSLDPWLRK